MNSSANNPLVTDETSADLPEWIKNLNRDGWGLIPGLFPASKCQDFIEGCNRAMNSGASGRLSTQGKTFGARHLLEHWDGWKEIVRHERLQSALLELLGSDCGLVRLLWFDKPPGAGWALPWHRDQTVAVREHTGDPRPFSKPTTKSGVPHLVAPDNLLQQMLTVRLHLDPMTMENGPLQIIPGSHMDSENNGRESNASIKTIESDAGTAFLMRPLILHGSLPPLPNTIQHRRILHLEFASNPALPGNVTWRNFVPVFHHDLAKPGKPLTV